MHIAIAIAIIVGMVASATIGSVLAWLIVAAIEAIMMAMYWAIDSIRIIVRGIRRRKRRADINAKQWAVYQAWCRKQQHEQTMGRVRRYTNRSRDNVIDA